MAVASDIPEHLIKFCRYDTSRLSQSTLYVIGKYLDPPVHAPSPVHRRLQDWRGLAEILNFKMLDIRNFEQSHTPTVEVLNKWLLDIGRNSTVEDLLLALCEIERYDLLQSDDMQQCFG